MWESWRDIPKPLATTENLSLEVIRTRPVRSRDDTDLFWVVEAKLFFCGQLIRLVVVRPKRPHYPLGESGYRRIRQPQRGTLHREQVINPIIVVTTIFASNLIDRSNDIGQQEMAVARDIEEIVWSRIEACDHPDPILAAA
jgi:hypothetical protein